MKWLSVVIALQVLAPPGLKGQHVIRWWEAALTVGAIGSASLFDRSVNDWIQAHRSSRSDAVARAFRHGGQPEVFLTVSGGMIAAGFIAHNPELRRRGARVLVSVGVAGVSGVALKKAFGRVRPESTRDPYLFRPWSANESFPSGHTTVAFAFAASLADEIHNRWVTAALYAGAAGTGWSRMNDHRHWLSDVLGGAALGITAAKLVEGRWQVFGLHPPAFLVGPRGELRLQWTERF
jgi:membrane-associated phospholipid phosphatase